MLCPRCSTELPKDALYCHHCGERLDGHAPAQDAPADTDRVKDAVGSGSDEPRELWRGGFATQAMLPTWIATGLATVVALVAAAIWLRGLSWWLVLLGALAVLWLYQLATLLYRRTNVRYVLNSQVFIHETGILRRVSDRIEVIQIDDVTFEQTLLDRLAGTGTIRISSADRSHPELVLRGIHDVKRVAETIDDARRVERRRRGLRVEQI